MDVSIMLHSFHFKRKFPFNTKKNGTKHYPGITPVSDPEDGLYKANFLFHFVREEAGDAPKLGNTRRALGIDPKTSHVTWGQNCQFNTTNGIAASSVAKVYNFC